MQSIQNANPEGAPALTLASRRPPLAPHPPQTSDPSSCAQISPELIAEICGACRSLSTLNLSHNEITVVENLEQLPSLRRLDLSYNAIEGSLVGLGGLRELTHLDLSANALRSLVGLERLASLEVLLVADNELCAPECALPLEYLPRLQALTLRGNPLAQLDDYRDDMAHRLPALTTLDGELVVRSAPRSASASSAAARRSCSSRLSSARNAAA